MKNLYLREISNSVLIQNLLSEALHEMLEVKGKFKIVSFFYPGWPTATYIQKLAFRISDSMYKVGETLAKEKFKSFNPEKTKLTLEMLNEMWMEASRVITEEIYKGFDTGFEVLHPNRIPGLRESLKEGAIIPKDRDENYEAMVQRIDEGRETMIQKAEKIDYQDELLRRLREKYFSYMRETYGLFEEQKKELNKEWQGKFH